MQIKSNPSYLFSSFNRFLFPPFWTSSSSQSSHIIYTKQLQETNFSAFLSIHKLHKSTAPMDESPFFHGQMHYIISNTQGW